MRRLEELEAAVFHVRDVSAHELELEEIGMMRAPEEHRLALEQHAFLARLEHARHDVARLVLVVGDGDVARLVALRFPRIKLLADERVRRIEDRLGGAIVFFEGHHRGGEALFEGKDVLDARCTKRIDRLRVVADHGEAGAVGPQALEDPGLQHVGVLVLVDEHVVEERADVVRERVVRHHRVPVEQQIVVVERLIAELSFNVIAK